MTLCLTPCLIPVTTSAAICSHRWTFGSVYYGPSLALERNKRVPLRAHMSSLSYSESLRAIGHSLEVLGVSTFGLEKQGANYIVRATGSTTKKKFLNRIAEILKQPRNSNEHLSEPLCYMPRDILRLAGQQQAQHRKADRMPDAHKLAQILRMVGYYLDRKEARTFSIFVSGHLLMVWYETTGGHQKRDSFTLENLYDLAVHMYLRRWKRSA
jgi:hypothetical protein